MTTNKNCIDLEMDIKHLQIFFIAAVSAPHWNKYN